MCTDVPTMLSRMLSTGQEMGYFGPKSYLQTGFAGPRMDWYTESTASKPSYFTVL